MQPRSAIQRTSSHPDYNCSNVPRTDGQGDQNLNVERRPYQWVSFDYVAMQPKQKSTRNRPGLTATDGQAEAADEHRQIVGTWKVVDSSSWDKLFKTRALLVTARRKSGCPSHARMPRRQRQRTPTVITKDTLFGFYQYKLDASKNPKALDVLLHGKVVMLGIYELQGDRLQFHFSKTSRRPTTFDHKPEDDADDLYVLLERVTTP